MATGYTHRLLDEKQSFQEFTMSCARAFGALVMMRDEPMNAPIDDKQFEPAGYYIEARDEAKANLDSWLAASPDERLKAMRARRESSIEGSARYRDQCRAEDAELTAMRLQVEKWNPPTAEHQGLKDFMLQQIDTSIHGDEYWQKSLAASMRLDPQAMANEEEGRLRDYLARAETSLAEEIERQATRKEWVVQLRQSLAAVPA